MDGEKSSGAANRHFRHSEPPFLNSVMNPDADFKIVLLHDDPVSAVRGTSVLERLAGQMQEECDKLDTAMWKFEVLKHPEVREQATSRIREANMIMISTDGAGELPEYVKSWIEGVLSQRQDREAAIVALLNWEPRSDHEVPRLAHYLRKLAETSGLAFFCNQGEQPPRSEPPAEPRSATVNPPHLSQNRDDFAAWNDVVPRDSSLYGWGIND
jgi:hypothetical protein